MAKETIEATIETVKDALPFGTFTSGTFFIGLSTEMFVTIVGWILTAVGAYWMMRRVKNQAKSIELDKEKLVEMRRANNLKERELDIKIQEAIRYANGKND